MVHWNGELDQLLGAIVIEAVDDPRIFSSTRK
jgi:hypothetical protein